VLAQVLAQTYGVTLLDADPNQPLATWARRDPERVPEQLTVVPDVNENTILDLIDTNAAKDPFVVVDLEGTANIAVSYAIGRSDLVVIPTRGSQLDADQSARVIQMIDRQQKAFKRKIPFAVLFTCTNVLRGKDFKHIQSQLEAANVPILPTEMVERAAFRTIMQIGGTIYDLTKADVSNPEYAVRNAEEMAQAIVAFIQNGAAHNEQRA
jgi:chromosome partitioning protein